MSLIVLHPLSTDIKYQRVTQLGIVLANGEIKTISSTSTNEQDKALFS